jgi:3-hydroxyisobutyrate dehydrogenase-like beta-hydroxyacid dehydrogenase
MSAPVTGGADAGAAAGNPPSTVGIVGTGNMGAPMCANLVDQGIDVIAFDVTPAGVAAATEAGAKTAGSLAELAGAVEVVVLSLPTSAHVERVVLGDDGLLHAPTRTVHTIIDTTSGDPAATQRIAAAAAAQGVSMIDVGVSGGHRGSGVLAAREGSLKLMVGGDADVVAANRPLLSVIGGDVFVCGDIGAGHSVKALHNLRGFTHTAANVEVLVCGAALGLDVHVLAEVVGAPKMFADLLTDPDSGFKADFTLGLFSKDCDIAMDLANSAGVTMMVSSAAANAARVAAADEGYDTGFQAIVQAVSRWSRLSPGGAGDH